MPLAPKVSESAFAHWLPYWWIGDAAIVAVDGSITLGWRLHGVDTSSATDHRCNAIAGNLRQFINSLPIGYHAQFLRRSSSNAATVAEQYLEAAKPQHPLLQEQRRAGHSALRSRDLRTSETFLLLTAPRALGRLGDHSRNGAVRLFDRLLGRTDPASVAREAHLLAVRGLEEGAPNLLRHLVSTGARLERLDDNGLTALAFRALNPDTQKVPELTAEFPPPELPATSARLYRALSLREQLVHSSLSWSADTIFMGTPLKPHRIVSFKDLPRRTVVQAIEAFSTCPIDYLLTVDITVPDTERKYEEVEKRRNRAQAMAAGHVRNVRASNQATELETALDAVTKHDQRVVSLAVHVQFAGQDLVELDRNTRLVADAWGRIQIPVATEYQSQLDAFLGQLPGNGQRAPHRRTVITSNAADLVPLYERSGGSHRKLFVATTRAGEACAVDLASPAKDNWNFTMFGASGSGKSFLTLGLLTSSFLGLNSPVIIVDVGGKDLGSYYRLVTLLGGDFVDVALDGATCINPWFSREDLWTTDDGEPAKQPNAGRVTFIVGLTRLLLTEADRPLSIAALAIIERCIITTYNRLGEQTPIYSDLAVTLDAFRGEDAEDTQLARSLAKTLRHVLSSARAQLFNGPSRVNIRSPFVVFDMKGLEALESFGTIMLLIISSYIWGMLSRRRSGDGWLAWVLYDECWKLLKDPTAAGMVAELFATIRKLRGGVGAITQNLDQALGVPAAASIFANAPTTFLLRHVQGHERVSKFFDLNPREGELFQSLQTVKGQFSEVFARWSEGGALHSNVLRFAPSSVDYWLFTTDPKDKELEGTVLAKHGGDRLSALRELARLYPGGAARGPLPSPLETK
ncbi:hypothetical protein HUA74_43985 [Myxococcus sp. CA051A]|uniref:VirB4 family type IV secretion system protein n=1 Tax=Myxococcus sp. CA051A TaxID=2741739 RepID=UPI00157A4F7A|nr:hypothetical protein [Myxococcus sp. CA051A]NTX67630.1 hypothetical protein [Myxococcus sp. CA051A]